MATASSTGKARGQATSTTNASPQVICSYTPPYADCIIIVTARIAVRDTTNGDSSSWEVAASFHRSGGGSVAQLGAGNTITDAKVGTNCKATLPAVQSDGAGGVRVSSAQSQNATLLWDCEFDVFEWRYA